MSERNKLPQQDYSKFDIMSTDKLEEILWLDAQLPEGETPDPDAILYIMEVLAQRERENKSENALPTRMVENLDNYIRENYSEEISNTEIGAIFGYHPFYVSRMLKDKKGITLRQYIISYRFKAAKKLLRHWRT